MPWRRIPWTTRTGLAWPSGQTRSQLDFSFADLLDKIRHQQGSSEDERDEDANAEVAFHRVPPLYGATVRLKPDTTVVTVRLKPDITDLQRFC
jgi:hypothetical protein